MKNYNIGDSVKLKSGKVGVIEDYDNDFYYIKDNNCNMIKVKKIKDSEYDCNTFNDIHPRGGADVVLTRCAKNGKSYEEAKEEVKEWYSQHADKEWHKLSKQRAKEGVDIIETIMRGTIALDLIDFLERNRENFENNSDLKAALKNEVFEKFVYKDYLDDELFEEVYNRFVGSQN